jgi:hypothetical protein
MEILCFGRAKLNVNNIKSRHYPGEEMAVCCENHKKHKHELCEHNVEFLMPLCGLFCVTVSCWITRRMVWWEIKWKGSERKLLWPDRDNYYSGIHLEVLSKTMGNLRIANIPSEIRTERLYITCQERYCYSKQCVVTLRQAAYIYILIALN